MKSTPTPTKSTSPRWCVLTQAFYELPAEHCAELQRQQAIWQEFQAGNLFETGRDIEIQWSNLCDRAKAGDAEAMAEVERHHADIASFKRTMEFKQNARWAELHRTHGGNIERLIPIASGIKASALQWLGKYRLNAAPWRSALGLPPEIAGDDVTATIADVIAACDDVLGVENQTNFEPPWPRFRWLTRIDD